MGDRLGIPGAVSFSFLKAFNFRLRPYHVESTGSRPITEVKQRRAWLVLGWVTAWEYTAPEFFLIFRSALGFRLRA